MKIAILGGTQFIGPYIVRDLLRLGHQVAVYHRGRTVHELDSSVRHVTIDRTVKGSTAAALKHHRPDAVIDMCGFYAYQVQEVLSALSNTQHYVFCGSTSVYGIIGKTTPDEKSPLDPRSEYECGKVACENVLLDAHHKGFPITIMRLAHPYGPGHAGELIYNSGRESLFLDRIRCGRPIIIAADGLSRIHPIYVEDAAAAFVHVLARNDCLGRIFNLAGDEILTQNEYFASISRVLGQPLNPRYIPLEKFERHAPLWEGKPRNFTFAPIWYRYETAFATAALAQTGFRCRTNHDQGVAAAVAWLDENHLIPASSDADLEDLFLCACRD